MRQALLLLERDQPLADVLELVGDIARGQPCFARAQYIRSVCALRMGRPEQARDLLVDAIQGGERTIGATVALAQVAGELDAPSNLLAGLANLLSRSSGAQFAPLLSRVTEGLGFADLTATARRDRVFKEVLVPTLRGLLSEREMDSAIALESYIYNSYVKPTETAAHFDFCMQHIAPPFTAAAEAWRAELAPLPKPLLTPPYRIGFFLHNASTLAHVEVLLNTLKGYRLLDDQPFEPVVYCLGGKSAPMEEALQTLGVRLVMLNEHFPEAGRSIWQRLLGLRELLAAEGVHQIVWVSLVTMLPLAFGLRLAPVQTWLAMKYRNFSHPEIDGYVTGSALTRFRQVEGRRWRMGQLGVDNWYDVDAEPKAQTIRKNLGDRVVAMTLARTEKMRDETYLTAIVEVLQRHPQVIFLWAGREEDPFVVQAFRAGGVLGQTSFIGWVDTRLYAQVADIFLDTFPFPCGFTLFQAMAAGKPVVTSTSPEAAQTGLWAFLKPLVEDEEGSAEERSELRSYIGDDIAPLISVSRTPEEFVRFVARLIDDAQVRETAGAAARAFIARYFSDPRRLGESIGRHLVELIEERAAAEIDEQPALPV